MFIRRILQVSAELQDFRDVVQLVVRPPRLSSRQYDLVVNDSTLDPECDPSLDPSVRFFGLDWQQVFGRLFSLSLNFQIFRTQVVGEVQIDLVLLSSILKDATRVEADVMSHGEAVLNGRLSKSQQRLIQQEQNRLSSLALNADGPTGAGGFRSSKVSKSRSFRDTTGQKKQHQQQRALSRYKKTRTADLDKLQVSATATGGGSTQQLSTCAAAAAAAAGKDDLTAATRTNEWREVMTKAEEKRKNSFLKNTVNSIFKNMR